MITREGRILNKILTVVSLMLICMIIVSGFGVTAIVNNAKFFNSKSTTLHTNEKDFSHNILGEFGTSTTCIPCKYAHSALKEIYLQEWYPFYYISLVRNKNKHAYLRTIELDLYSEPSVFWDGGYGEDQGASSKQQAMTIYNSSLNSCGVREVADIDLFLDAEWKGAVNPVPEEGATNVSVAGLSWNLSAMNINVSIKNNETFEYEGHLHVYVTELNSSYWNDKYNLPYSFAFLDYAWNEDIQIGAGGTWEDSMEWDGVDYNNNDEDPPSDYQVYDDIWQDNTMIVASVFNNSSGYSDETTGKIAGVNTDPKHFRIYFGNTTPPPLILTNYSGTSFLPSGELQFNTTYYWKVDVVDNQGKIIKGEIWDFTVRDNHPPDVPSNPIPSNNSNNAPINTNLSWVSQDPDYDTEYFDVYFGSEFPLDIISHNQTELWHDPYGTDVLDFNTQYFWKIVAWDRWGYSSTGPIWSFTTQDNLPPYKPSNPFPTDGAPNAPINISLSWKGSDPNPGDSITYDVYLGTECPPQNLVASNQTETSYAPSELEVNITYYWYLVAWDSQGLSNESSCWSFTAAINNPPGAPEITGPGAISSFKLDNKIPLANPPGTYNYTFRATDPDDDEIFYYIDWGDGSNEDWFGSFPSGIDITVSHTWYHKGCYIIKAKAKDIYEQEGPWGTMSIPIENSRNKAFNYNALLPYFLLEIFPNFLKLIFSL